MGSVREGGLCSPMGIVNVATLPRGVYQHPFEVWTDHKNLEALKTPRRLFPKQVRWMHA